MKVFKKLSKEELKTITAGGVCTSCNNNGGGNNNPPQGGNDWVKVCGTEPPICASAAWIAWNECLGRYHFSVPPTCV